MLGAARVYLELDRQGDQATTHPSQAHTFVNLQPFQQVFTVVGEGSLQGQCFCRDPSPSEHCENLLQWQEVDKSMSLAWVGGRLVALSVQL